MFDLSKERQQTLTQLKDELSAVAERPDSSQHHSLSAFTVMELLTRCIFLSAKWENINEFIEALKGKLSNVSSLNDNSRKHFTLPGASAMLHVAQVPRQDEGEEDVKFTLYGKMRDAFYLERELKDIKKEREHFSNYYHEYTGGRKPDELQPEAITGYRATHGRSSWKPSSWPPSFVIHIPSLVDRKPCGMCCATTDFGVGHGTSNDNLQDMVASDEKVRTVEPGQDKVHCAEMKNKVVWNRLKEESGDWQGTSVGLFPW
ncbi:MAG: hypothetical protein Q9181_004355 [Wetmoreana brouardii]